MEENTNDRMKTWEQHWEKNDTGWHKSRVHEHLQKHKSLLFKEGEKKKFFVPLCGKTLDMRWLSDEGHTVVGLDGVKKSVEEFCNEQGFEWKEEDVPSMGPGCQVMKVQGRDINLYSGDIFLFNKSVEGQFDCVWDRGSLVALDRCDVKAYAATIIDLLKPGGKIFVEVFEYDIAIFDDTPSHPPPFPVFEDEIKSLFEKDCTVELVERDTRQIVGKDCFMVFYLITKK